MKTGALLFLLWLLNTGDSAPDMEYLRSHYDKTVSDKQLCRSLIDQLSKHTGNNVHLAYLGAFQAIWANHTYNPVSKLSSFNKGKNNIEKAVKADPVNVEIRILRLSVQRQCPGFLGYNSNIKDDTVFLNEHINSVTSPALRKTAATLLTNTSK
jgi:hypothetical protein